MRVKRSEQKQNRQTADDGRQGCSENTLHIALDLLERLQTTATAAAATAATAATDIGGLRGVRFHWLKPFWLKPFWLKSQARLIFWETGFKRGGDEGKSCFSLPSLASMVVNVATLRLGSARVYLHTVLAVETVCRALHTTTSTHAAPTRVAERLANSSCDIRSTCSSAARSCGQIHCFSNVSTSDRVCGTAPVTEYVTKSTQTSESL